VYRIGENKPLSSENVEWRGRKFTLDADQKAFIEKSAKILVFYSFSVETFQDISQIDTAGLFQLYRKVCGDFSLNDESVEALLEFLWDEKIALWNCVATIIRKGTKIT
jgi:hypothetical protein